MTNYMYLPPMEIELGQFATHVLGSSCFTTNNYIHRKIVVTPEVLSHLARYYAWHTRVYDNAPITPEYRNRYRMEMLK